MFDEKLTYNPLKIEIERNMDMESAENIPFFITINGNRLENVRRFYIDLDKNKLFETHPYGKYDSTITEIKPWTYGVEFEDSLC